MPKGWIAGVGTRTAPEWALELMIRIGRTYTDMGYQMSSGDAWDSDRAFLYGAAQSNRYQEIGARVFLGKDGANGRWVADNPFYIDATLFDTVTNTTAKSMACQARGGFYGLNEYTTGLHVRNVYQIYGESLVDIVSGIYLYAEPNGKNKVCGGTNTALQLAKTAGVPIIKNLYYQSVVDEIELWLAENELPYDYIDTDWTQIHKPSDPRLKEFE